MPIYDYRCQSCGSAFELLVLKGTEPACPQCESKQIDQQISSFAVSSAEITQANVKAARARYKSSSTFKDKQVAEAEEIKHHHDDHH